uniref:Uncharacterized protein n=1 Tax=Arundo donax TaxID=35708 RepID=A0A0A9E7U4_ARUDO
MNGQSFQGKDALKRYLAENKNVEEDLMARLREKIMQNEFQPDRNKDINLDTSLTEDIVSATDEEVRDEVEA